MLSAYRVLALDIDGTMTNSRGVITNQVKQAVRRAEQSGLMVYLVSGRRTPHVRMVTDQLGITTPFVAFNGAVVMDGTKLLSCHHLDLSQLQEVIRSWEKEAFTVFAYGNGLMLPNLYSGRPVWGPTRHKITEEQGTLKNVSSLLDCKLAVVRLMVADQQDVADAARSMATPHLTGLPIRSLFTTDHQGLWIFEILPAVGKADGLVFLSQQLGVRPHEVIAVGDDINDVDMLKWAGWGVAMGNAPEAVKAVADSVIGRHDDNGLAHFIHAVIDGYTQHDKDPVAPLQVQKG